MSQRDRKRIYPFAPSRRNPLEAFLLLLSSHRLWISNDSTKACQETCYSSPAKPPHESVICSTIGALCECPLGLLGDRLTGNAGAWWLLRLPLHLKVEYHLAYEWINDIYIKCFCLWPQKEYTLHTLRLSRAIFRQGHKRQIYNKTHLLI